MRKLTIIIISFLVVIVPSLAFCQENDWRTSVPEPFKGEGFFVEGPTFIGGATGTLCGLVIGVIPAMGAGIIGGAVELGDTVSGNNEKRPSSMEYGKATHGVFVKGGMYVGSYIFGTPFYLLKKTFYDLPVSVVSSAKPEQPVEQNEIRTSETLNRTSSD
jgi:hypothetical protein